MRTPDSHAAPPSGQTNNCRRCGACCLKGGPALHREDLPLLASAAITRSRLVTLCPGELAFIPQAADQGGGLAGQIGMLSLAPLSHDVIKIKGVGAKNGSPGQNSWTCVFYQAAVTEHGQRQAERQTGRLAERLAGPQTGQDVNAGRDRPAACRLHPNHPLECRLLDCRDPAGLLEAFPKTRLSRADISSPTEQAIQQAHAQGLRWNILGPDLAAAKEKFASTATPPPPPPIGKEKSFLPADLEKALLEAARFDQAFRELLLERGGQSQNSVTTAPAKQKQRTERSDPPFIERDALPFHLGRTVPELLRQFSLYISPDRRMIFHRPDPDAQAVQAALTTGRGGCLIT